MTMSGKKILTIVGLIVAALLLFGVGIYLWFLSSDAPLENPVANLFPWPVACTTRGCITAKTWQQQHALAQAFAATVKQTPPTPTETLTSAIRRELLSYTVIRSPVTLADARRYREEILHVKNEATLVDSFGVTATDYDRLVLMPFLQQEALRQERSLESA